MSLSSNSILIKGVRLYGEGDPVDVLVTDGQIAEIGTGLVADLDLVEVIDADGQVLRWTGTFNEYRWRNPIAGAKYLLGEQFAFIAAIGMRQRQEEQSELFVAMMARLQVLARETFDAPLVIVYSWPDEKSRAGDGDTLVAHSLLQSTLRRVRDLGTPTIRVDTLTDGMEAAKIMIPHDGHPNAFTNEMVAGAVSRKLNLP